MADERTKRSYGAIVFGVALVCGVILLVLLRDIILLAFLGATLAVLFNWLAGMLRRAVPRLGQGPALAVVIVALLAVATVLVMAVARPIAREVSQLVAFFGERMQTLPADLEKFVRTQFGVEIEIDDSAVVKEVLKSSKAVAQRTFGLALLAGSTVLTVMVVASLGVFFSIKPKQYNDLLLRYVGEENGERLRRALDRIGVKVRGWLGGTLFSAVFIAGLSTLALVLIGVRYAYVFGLLAGLMAFIPYFGPIISVVPPGLFALASPQPIKALWVVLVFVAIQTVESNVFTPMVMQRRIELPPGVVVLAVLVMGALLGFLGAVLALPLTLAIQALLDEFVLGKRQGSSGSRPTKG
ncbi:MAG: AI-2E family transporter [Verrucomicrobia bacterium]|nr:AI-2E family transporter [Verrucomicrobiota bacterium]